MKFLLDENLSPALAELLNAAGHPTVHVRDLGLSGAADPVVVARAVSEDRVVVSADTDFGQLLARSQANRPSVVIFRRERSRRAADQARLLLANLSAVLPYLESGAIVVLEQNRIRVRDLPIAQQLAEGITC